MGRRFKVPVAVMALILRHGGTEILLHQRKNTGFADGWWDCAASGHVEANEAMTAAMAREAAEEIGIDVNPADIRFATVLYKRHPEDGVTYVDVFFVIEAYQGTPRIAEPDKSAALEWFPLDALPEALIPGRRRGIELYLAGAPFGEMGFE